MDVTSGPRQGLVRKSASTREIRTILAELSRATVRGRRITYGDRVQTMRKLASVGGIPTMELLLPLLLTLDGNPYSLHDHFAFSPLFKFEMPSNLVYITGRQVGKTTDIAAHGVVTSNCIPFFKTLYVTPLYEQIRRFSTNYVRPFIENSPVKSLWLGTNTEKSVLQRSFKNQSKMIFSFALLDADRVRGVSADKVAIDEVQDMDPDHLPIIRETMSHSRFSIQQMTGTPKSLDGPLHGLFMRSSQAEWFIPCYACGHWNIPSMEFDLMDMIGPFRDDISSDNPATVCAYCRRRGLIRSINPRHGHWKHRYPERVANFSGFHVPQIIMPIHYSSKKKWSELLAKREGWGNTTFDKFCNEVLGVSTDSGAKLITQSELQAAAILGWANDCEQPDARIFDRLRDYRMRVLGVDWGGGGEDGVSFTTLALMGLAPNGQIHVLWGKRLLTPHNHMREAIEIRRWLQRFDCQLLAHDYTGAGTVRETVLAQAGIDLNRVMPIQYIGAATRGIITCVAPTVLHPRTHYRLDKTRSLLYTTQAIKLKLIQFFNYDYQHEDNTGLLHDFLALVENKAESRTGSDIYTITRNPMLTDDFAHSCNLGATALWHANDAWPNFAQVAGLALTQTQLAAAGNRDYGWDNDAAYASFFETP